MFEKPFDELHLTTTEAFFDDLRKREQANARQRERIVCTKIKAYGILISSNNFCSDNDEKVGKLIW